tara:strand:- start:257 stop:547 length:291 start_codon:yes stop_codon:yes gene_type:complete
MDKQRQNEDYYSNVIYEKSCSRITIPMMQAKHLANAVKLFGELYENLKEIQNSKQPIYRKLTMAKHEFYSVHCDLKVRANEPKLGAGPHNDFRGCK